MILSGDFNLFSSSHSIDNLTRYFVRLTKRFSSSSMVYFRNPKRCKTEQEGCNNYCREIIDYSVLFVTVNSQYWSPFDLHFISFPWTRTLKALDTIPARRPDVQWQEGLSFFPSDSASAL
jgi:hypothetical protein